MGHRCAQSHARNPGFLMLGEPTQGGGVGAPSHAGSSSYSDHGRSYARMGRRCAQNLAKIPASNFSSTLELVPLPLSFFLSSPCTTSVTKHLHCPSITITLLNSSIIHHQTCINQEPKLRKALYPIITIIISHNSNL